MIVDLYFAMKVCESKENSEFQCGKHQCDKSNGELAEFFLVNHQTVNNIVKKFNEEGHCRVEQRSRRPSIMSERTKRLLKREIIRNRCQCVKDVTNSMEMLPYVVRTTLKELGY